MSDQKIIVSYSDKKNSSGKVLEGTIYLNISSRLSPQEKERHISKLTGKLAEKISWAQRYQFESAEGIVKTDEELFRLAQTINKEYYNFVFNKIEFHKQNSTWGTCSLKTRQIFISHRLIGAPMELLWYVITHELCHLGEPSHNQRFWQMVSRACPRYEECRKMLKAYGLQLR